MVRDIVRDPMFLAGKSEIAGREDIETIKDLKDTLRANSDRCVGMAANMIGVRKRIIAIAMGPFQMVMINPVIVRKESPFDTEEGCLSLDGVRPCTRYEEIEVEYLDERFEKKKRVFKEFTAQIIQHECDHLEGIVI